jgi:hypothetical protein
MPVEQREQVTHITWSQRATGGTPSLDGRRQPSLGGTSRMNREIHVRICGGLGVQFPGPTRRDGAVWITEQMEAQFGAQANYLVDFPHLCGYLIGGRRGNRRQG